MYAFGCDHICVAASGLYITMWLCVSSRLEPTVYRVTIQKLLKGDAILRCVVASSAAEVPSKPSFRCCQHSRQPFISASHLAVDKVRIHMLLVG